MSESENEGTPGQHSITDEELPEDLRPTEDNPLAQPADDDVPDDVITQDVEPASGGSDDGGDSSGGGDDTDS